MPPRPHDHRATLCAVALRVVQGLGVAATAGTAAAALQARAAGAVVRCVGCRIMCASLGSSRGRSGNEQGECHGLHLGDVAVNAATDTGAFTIAACVEWRRQWEGGRSSKRRRTPPTRRMRRMTFASSTGGFVRSLIGLHLVELVDIRHHHHHRYYPQQPASEELEAVVAVEVGVEDVELGS